jgi:catechol 2,3-dioxygenase-like lactoylglutathione lyase family enzyme
VLWFPPDKGNPKWHVASDKLFLGIDHTAVVISETEASLKFYRDRLGMEVAGESENYGPEQERLNNVFGARLHITALRANSGPGIEFLEYLAPRDGRPFPPEEKANDLIHWQTRFLGISADEAAQTLRNSRSAFVSTGAVEHRTAKRDSGKQSRSAIRMGTRFRSWNGNLSQLSIRRIEMRQVNRVLSVFAVLALLVTVNSFAARMDVHGEQLYPGCVQDQEREQREARNRRAILHPRYREGPSVLRLGRGVTGRDELPFPGLVSSGSPQTARKRGNVSARFQRRRSRGF